MRKPDLQSKYNLINERRRNQLETIMRKMNDIYFYQLLISPLQVQILAYIHYYETKNNKGPNREILERDLMIPRTTIYDNILRLNDHFPSIYEQSIQSGKRGRPIILYHLTKEFKEGLDHLRRTY